MTTAADIEALGYSHARQLTEGHYAGKWLCLRGMMFTVGLCIVDEESVLTRFCYDGWGDAIKAAEEWDGKGWPPHNWIKQKPQDVPNPERKTSGR